MEKNVQMLGIVRQELLSGIKTDSQYETIRKLISSFPDLLASSKDHSQAAKFYNLCRNKGIQGSPVDFLICAQAYNNKLAILTEDKDFKNYAKYLPIRLVG